MRVCGRERRAAKEATWDYEVILPAHRQRELRQRSLIVKDKQLTHITYLLTYE